MTGKSTIEIEARFLEIDKPTLIKKLKALKARDLGDKLLEEIIFYDKALEWKYQSATLVRLRKIGDRIFLAYKNSKLATIDGTEEVEVEVNNFEKTKIFLEKIGLVAFRVQQKRRHSFKLGNVTVDIDTWPKIPTYVELEGPSESALKKTAKALGFNWSEVVFENPRMIIENRYGIPVSDLHHFTFHKIA